MRFYPSYEWLCFMA